MRGGQIDLLALPDITDSKSAAYNDEPIIGRTAPLKTYSYSENRVISMILHFYITTERDKVLNLGYLRAIESATYPRNNSGAPVPFLPPVVCGIRCGDLLSTEGQTLDVVLKSYSVKFPTDVPWDTETYVPWSFDVNTTWEAVYDAGNLPGQNRILKVGQ